MTHHRIAAAAALLALLAPQAPARAQNFYFGDLNELLSRLGQDPSVRAREAAAAPPAARQTGTPASAKAAAARPRTSPAPAPAIAPSAALAAAPPQGGQQLLPSDVGAVISRVVSEARARGTPATIAVVDRVGAVLAVYQMQGAPQTLSIAQNPHGAQYNAQLAGFDLSAPGAAGAAAAPAAAIAKAVTAAYLSTSSGNAFSTRTASQIVQDHFNPGTRYAPAGPLYGVQFSSLPCSDLVVRVASADPSTLTRGPHRTPLGLSADPGGLPLYKNGQLVGAVGVKAAGAYGDDLNIHDTDRNTDEILALAGTSGLDAPASIRADHISVGGLLLRYSDATPNFLLSRPSAAPPFAALPAGLIDVKGYYAASDALRSGSVYGSAASGLVPDTSGSISTATPAYLLVNAQGQPRYPATAGAGPAALSQREALTVLRNAYAVALQTRAQIRNSPGAHAAVTVSLVDASGTVLGVASTPDAPMFGVDVSLQKARSAAFLSSRGADSALHTYGFASYADAANHDFGRQLFASGYAWSERAIGNISRDTLPDGADGSPNGPLSLSAAQTTPFSDGLQLALVLGNLGAHLGYLNPAAPPATHDTPASCTPLIASTDPTLTGALANGLQVFPGGFPIYRNGTLIGGIGVSGDGVDQDDLISFLGLYNAGLALRSGVGHAASSIRADTLAGLGVKPHYANCPFKPFVTGSAQNVCAGK